MCNQQRNRPATAVDKRPAKSWYIWKSAVWHLDDGSNGSCNDHEARGQSENQNAKEKTDVRRHLVGHASFLLQQLKTERQRLVRIRPGLQNLAIHLLELVVSLLLQLLRSRHRNRSTGPAVCVRSHQAVTVRFTVRLRVACRRWRIVRHGGPIRGSERNAAVNSAGSRFLNVRRSRARASSTATGSSALACSQVRGNTSAQQASGRVSCSRLLGRRIRDETRNV
mmetsp:Transcript_52818/g.140434  ORF Transcript_52818/g.140434 Transcript_52818/m.140434 type:complete len:224 (-) Transcript_52818:697-1368(-)